MRGSLVDIENELSDVAAEAEMLADALDLFARDTDEGPAWKWLALQGLASGVEKIYTGCERVMSMIAQSVDGAKVEHDDSWHTALLKRMAHPFPGVRDQVLSPECYQALDRLRSFRHRQRNTYGLTLDAELVRQRAREATQAFKRFRVEVSALLTAQSTL